MRERRSAGRLGGHGRQYFGGLTYGRGCDRRRRKLRECQKASHPHHRSRPEADPSLACQRGQLRLVGRLLRRLEVTQPGDHGVDDVVAVAEDDIRGHQILAKPQVLARPGIGGDERFGGVGQRPHRLSRLRATADWRGSVQCRWRAGPAA